MKLNMDAMYYRSARALSFSEIGRKDNQEDSVFPSPSFVKRGQKYFILCDGMGGHACGEVASNTVSKALGKYFDAHPFEVADEAYFKDALDYAYSQLDLVDTGSEKKMGTTLTCLLLNPHGFLAAHIGDSRIYQFRAGRIVFQTSDHSLVNDLVKAGEITEEEARNYPRKNVITRAMQPNTRRAKADIHVSEDLRPGDFFFMCCDGVLERWTNEDLCRVFSGNPSSSRVLAAIKAECDKGTRDNYTCWLIPIEEGNGSTVPVRPEEPGKQPARHSSWLPVFVALVIGLLAGYYLGEKNLLKTRKRGDPAQEQQDSLTRTEQPDTVSLPDDRQTV